MRYGMKGHRSGRCQLHINASVQEKLLSLLKTVYEKEFT